LSFWKSCKFLGLCCNPALDFVRKREFNIAESVFRHSADHNPKIDDAVEKLGRAKAYRRLSCPAVAEAAVPAAP
jgi:hypothetical protein